MPNIYGGEEPVEATLRRNGCPYCGRVMDETFGTCIRHPQLGVIHGACYEEVTWKHVGGTSGRVDYEDSGDGYARWGEEE